MRNESDGSGDCDRLQKILEALDDLVRIQCSDGNWNYDPYMHGMANGLLLAQSLFSKGGCPDYLEPPEVWGKDVPMTDEPTVNGE